MVERARVPATLSRRKTAASLFAFILILAAFMVFTSLMVAPYLLAVLMGGILAILSFPLHRQLLKRGWRPRIAAFFLTLGTFFLIVGPILIFGTLAARQGVNLAQYLAETEVFTLDRIFNLLAQWKPIASLLEPEEIEKQLRSFMQSAAKNASELVLLAAKGIPQGVLQILLAAITCYFMLLDGRKFLRWSYARLPLASDVRLRLFEVFHQTVISVIWASMAAALAQAVIVAIAFLSLGVPAAFLAGGVTFIFAFIPFLGSFAVWGTGVIYLLVNASYGKAVGMVLFGIVTITIDNIIRPWILKGRNEMHPLVALVAIFGGIQMFGLLGVFLGPIFVAVLISLLQIWPVIGQRYGLEFDTGFEDRKPPDLPDEKKVG